MRSTTLTCHPRWLHLVYPYTCEFFVSSHDFDTPDVFCNYMYAWYFFLFGIARERGVDICVPVLFLHSGARCVEVARVTKGGVFGFASVVVFWRKVNTLFQTLPQNVRSVQDFLHNIKNITKPQVRVRREGRRRD
jgi:hypothetical protein